MDSVRVRVGVRVRISVDSFGCVRPRLQISVYPVPQEAVLRLAVRLSARLSVAHREFAKSFLPVDIRQGKFCCQSDHLNIKLLVVSDAELQLHRFI